MKWVPGGPLSAWGADMRKKSLLRADIYVPGVAEIDLNELWGKGIRGILLDLDNTLTLWRGMEVSAAIQEWLRQAKERGFRLCILSNSRSASRVEPIERLLAVRALHLSGKPRPSSFRKGCRELNLPKEQVAMVGDQLFTDICGGNLFGLLTILTEMIDPHELWGTRHIARPLERLVRAWQRKIDRRKILKLASEKTN